MLDTVKYKKTEVVSNVIEPAVFLKRLTRHRDNGGQTGNLHMLSD